MPKKNGERTKAEVKADRLAWAKAIAEGRVVANAIGARSYSTPEAASVALARMVSDGDDTAHLAAVSARTLEILASEGR